MQLRHVRRSSTVLLGAGLAVSALGTAALTVALSAPNAAFADTTCYPASSLSCTTTTTLPTTAQAQAQTQATDPTPPATSASAGLPFTGADVEQLAAIGGGAILLGGILLRRGRRRSYTESEPAMVSVPGLVIADRTVWSQWPSDSPSRA